MRILVDMDGVIADFEGGFLKSWRAVHPENPFVPIEQRITFYLVEQYPADLKDLVQEIYLSPYFFRSLAPIEGCVEALSEIKAMGHEVFICSSPLTSNRYCVLEKYEWVESYFGKEWVNNIILCKDKTIVKGDVLIDDRPNITGLYLPSWEHIIYDQPYNRGEMGKKRLDWSNWKSVLFSLDV
jgi:5'-nucleotidase